MRILVIEAVETKAFIMAKIRGLVDDTVSTTYVVRQVSQN